MPGPSAKGTFPPDYHPETRGEFFMVGVGPVPIITTGDITSETTVVELPDHTWGTGGEEKPGSFDLKVPMSLGATVLALDAAVEKARGRVVPGYKSTASMSFGSLSGIGRRTLSLPGAWLSKRVDPGTDKGGDGAPLMLTYTCHYDAVIPTPG